MSNKVANLLDTIDELRNDIALLDVVPEEPEPCTCRGERREIFLEDIVWVKGCKYQIQSMNRKATGTHLVLVPVK